MRSIVAALALLAAGQSCAQDAPSGRVLYETYCDRCHDVKIHRRDPARSKVATIADLRDMVARWAPQTGRTFTPDEIEAVAQFLNATHYRRVK
jgi:mono/diheme cytochrome c family protein